jgi:hypothetical protein
MCLQHKPYPPLFSSSVSNNIQYYYSELIINLLHLPYIFTLKLSYSINTCFNHAVFRNKDIDWIALKKFLP